MRVIKLKASTFNVFQNQSFDEKRKKLSTEFSKKKETGMINVIK